MLSNWKRSQKTPAYYELSQYLTLLGHCLARLDGLVSRDIPLASKPDALITRGKAAPEILRVANDNKVDLIVVGLHGGKRMAGHLAASVAYQVVCGARCPVLTVPSGAPESSQQA